VQFGVPKRHMASDGDTSDISPAQRQGNDHQNASQSPIATISSLSLGQMGGP
jgi:hypothetical protein